VYLGAIQKQEVIVSIGDLVKFKSKRQSFEIQFLHDYITAS